MEKSKINIALENLKEAILEEMNLMSENHRKTLRELQEFKTKQTDWRKELKDFNSWMCGKQYDGVIPMIDRCIDEYLKSKQL